jgi:hypothetical protein
MPKNQDPRERRTRRERRREEAEDNMRYDDRYTEYVYRRARLRENITRLENDSKYKQIQEMLLLRVVSQNEGEIK